MWESVVDRLAHAPRVHVMGLRKCHAPAYLLSYLLGMLREDVTAVDASAGSLTDELRRVRAGDCFVAMSIHRYSLDTVRAAQWARQRGAHVIALTDRRLTAGGVGARHVLHRGVQRQRAPIDDRIYLPRPGDDGCGRTHPGASGAHDTARGGKTAGRVRRLRHRYRRADNAGAPAYSAAAVASWAATVRR
jgi:hypothetical protein